MTNDPSPLLNRTLRNPHRLCYNPDPPHVVDLPDMPSKGDTAGKIQFDAISATRISISPSRAASRMVRCGQIDKWRESQDRASRTTGQREIG